MSTKHFLTRIVAAFTERTCCRLEIYPVWLTSNVLQQGISTPEPHHNIIISAFESIRFYETEMQFCSAGEKVIVDDIAERLSASFMRETTGQLYSLIARVKL
jgi:hypothetical protein